jgi:hypothetical protein
MRLLEDIGLIEIEGKGNSAFGYVLLRNPLAVAEKLHQEGKVDSEWWKLLQQQVLDSTGALLRDRLDAPRQPDSSSQSPKRAIPVEGSGAGRPPEDV